MNFQSPYISIIIPTYNSEKTLSKCLHSIIDQSFSAFEILIIDNRSVDSTLEIAKSYNDERINFLSEEDAGIYSAMNKGIKKASGQWLYFMGSDDVLFDNDVLRDIHSSTLHNGKTDVIYGNVFLKGAKKLYDGQTSLFKLMHERNICHQAVFYHTSVFSKLGSYNERYKLLADWDFNIRCFQHPDLIIVFVDRIICLFNDAGKSSNYKAIDYEFTRNLPCFSDAEKVRYLLQRNINYKTGRIILAPFRWLNNVILKRINK
jgi:glycosyltransferase involved in cell wall biosynthesis